MLHAELPTLSSYDVRVTGLCRCCGACFLEWTIGGIADGSDSSAPCVPGALVLRRRHAASGPPAPASLEA